MIFNFAVHSGLHQQLHNLVPVETYCIVQGRIPFLRAETHTRQQPSQKAPQVAAAYPVFGVDLDATGQQVLHDVDVAGPGGHVQRRAAQLQRCTPAEAVTGS